MEMPRHQSKCSSYPWILVGGKDENGDGSRCPCRFEAKEIVHGEREKELIPKLRRMRNERQRASKEKKKRDPIAWAAFRRKENEGARRSRAKKKMAMLGSI